MGNLYLKRKLRASI